MNRNIKRMLVKLVWWFAPILGTTLNQYLGGESVTGLSGGYEKRTPDDKG